MHVDWSKIENAKVGESLPIIDEEGKQVINFLSYKSDYKSKTTPEIFSFIESNFENFKNVPTDSLRLNGHVVQDSFEKYLSQGDYLSSSILKKALITPRHYLFEKIDNPKLRKLEREKKSFKIGTFIHQCILEPTKFSRVVVEPKGDIRTKKGCYDIALFFMDQMKNFEYGFLRKKLVKHLSKLDLKGMKVHELKEFIILVKKVTGLISVSEADNLRITAFKQVYDNYAGGILKKLLKHSKREISMYGEDPETGQKIRIRPDAIIFEENAGENIILSVKSTASHNLSHFFYDCAKYEYDLSEAMYQDVASFITGRKFYTTLMLMVQTVPPYGIALIRMSEKDIATGRYKYRRSIQNVCDFESSGSKMSYDSFAEPGNYGVIESNLPEWNSRELPSVNFEL